MFARTRNLLLRPGWNEDVPALARAIRASARSANATDDAMADAEAFVAQPCDVVLPRFLITMRTDGAPIVIGTCGLTRRASGRIEFGCWIAEDYRSRGFATEAGKALLDIATTLGLCQVEASHFVDHAPSGRLLEKLGFTTTGLTAPRYNCMAREETNARLMRVTLDCVQETAPLAA